MYLYLGPSPQPVNRYYEWFVSKVVWLNSACDGLVTGLAAGELKTKMSNKLGNIRFNGQ